MQADVGSLISPTIWQHNLRALTETAPALADQLAAWTLPDSIHPVVGKDGRPTYRLFPPDGDPQWFGRTSMPTVSGPALLEAFDPGDGNVLLPGVGQGYEMQHLTDRLPAHRAVFILESRLDHIALALRLYDVSAPLRSGRLVIIPEEDQVAALTDFLMAHPGYVAPSRLLAWPWMSPAQQQESRLIVERAATLAAHASSQTATTLCDELRRLPPESAADLSRVVLLGFQPDERTNELARGLEAACADLNWPTRICIADRPEHVVTIQHGQVVRDHRPHWALLINHARGHYRDLFGPNPPMVSYLQGHLRLHAEFAEMVGPEDWVATETATQREALIGWGLAADRIIHLGPAGDPFVFGRPPRHPDVPIPEPVDLAVIADGCDVSPAANGVRLPSHVALWEAVLAQIAGDVDKYWPADTDQFFRRGAQASGIQLKESQVATDLTAKIAVLPGPTVQMLSWLSALIERGVNVALWGSGWEAYSTVAGIWKGPVRHAPHRNAVYRSANLTLLPDQADPPGSPVYDATLAGTLVLRRARSLSPARDTPSPANLPTFQRRAQLLNLVANFLEDPRRIREVLEPVRLAITRSGGWTHRLETLRNHLQNKTIAPR
jgi:hypothetical protein